ncbi:MAG TPA: hypothetical protein P5191_01265 [Ruminococcus sp.]|nr:hypothetical protein [Ruminococcus sp.]
MKYRLPAFLAASVLLLTGCGKSDPGTDDNSESDVIITVESTEETSEAENETETVCDAVEEEETSEDSTEECPEETTTEDLNNSEETINTTACKESNIPADEDVPLLYALFPGDDADDVLSLIGKAPDRQRDTIYRDSQVYEWDIDSDDIFGTGLPGMFFVEISDDDQTLIETGYELGNAGSDTALSSVFSKDELEKAYDQVVSQFNERFGDPRISIDEEDNGVLSSRGWKVDTDNGFNWYNVYYGDNLWNDGIGEVIIKKGYL